MSLGVGGLASLNRDNLKFALQPLVPKGIHFGAIVVQTVRLSDLHAVQIIGSRHQKRRRKNCGKPYEAFKGVVADDLQGGLAVREMPDVSCQGYPGEQTRRQQ